MPRSRNWRLSQSKKGEANPYRRKKKQQNTDGVPDLTTDVQNDIMGEPDLLKNRKTKIAHIGKTNYSHNDARNGKTNDSHNNAHNAKTNDSRNDSHNNSYNDAHNGKTNHSAQNVHNESARNLLDKSVRNLLDISTKRQSAGTTLIDLSTESSQMDLPFQSAFQQTTFQQSTYSTNMFSKSTSSTATTIISGLPYSAFTVKFGTFHQTDKRFSDESTGNQFTCNALSFLISIFERSGNLSVLSSDDILTTGNHIYIDIVQDLIKGGHFHCMLLYFDEIPKSVKTKEGAFNVKKYDIISGIAIEVNGLFQAKTLHETLSESFKKNHLLC